MVVSDNIVFCEHDREPDECPTCRGESVEHAVFDPDEWVERLRASMREPAELPVELSGVPLN